MVTGTQKSMDLLQTGVSVVRMCVLLHLPSHFLWRVSETYVYYMCMCMGGWVGVLVYCVSVHGYVCTRTWLCAQEQMCVGRCLCAHAWWCVHACVRACVCVCACKGIRACVSLRTHVHMYCACMWIIGRLRGTQIRQKASFGTTVVPQPYHQKGVAAH